MRKRRRVSQRLKKNAPQSAFIVTFLQLIVYLTLYLLIKVGRIPQKIYKKVIIPLKNTGSKSWLISFKKKRGRPRKGSFKTTFVNIFPRQVRLRIALSVLAFLVLGYSLGIAKITLTLPSPSQLAPTGRPLTTQILDREGRVLYQFYEGRNRKLIKLEELPPSLISATIAIEDKHFYQHPGIDPIGIVRALKLNLTSPEPTLQGGSTLTQQLIKNTLLTSDQTIGRKIKEALLALWTERIYSKEEILQMYFNEAPYGGPAWGIETAAEMYFGKEARGLNLAESTYLAGLPAAPTEYSPYGIHPEKGKERQKEVLAQMVESSYLTQEEADRVFLEKLSFKAPISDIKAPHFVMYVRSVLAKKYGEKIVSQGGLKVITTLDLGLQEMAEEVVLEQITKLTPLKVGNGAAMVTDAGSGQILAMVGSKDYFNPQGGNFNVTLALRQPGSAIKPVTYATAFKIGYTPATILLDTPTNFPNPWGKPYSPVNYDGRFHGPVPIRTALGSSYNIPAVKMLQLVGISEMLKTARDMGITTLDNPENYGLSLTLGGGGVKLLDMMAVYGTLASGGIMFQPNPILKVIDPTGTILENNQAAEGKKAITEEVAYLINSILSDNSARAPAFGTNSQLQIPGHTVAAKTGTSDNKIDNWAFGYTPEYVVGVWVGNNDNSPMDPRLTSGITGATPIWHDIMSSLLADKPNLAFKRPAGIIETTVDGRKDLAISGQTPKTVVGYKRVKQTDESTGEEKEVTIFSDPFSTFTATQSAQVLPTQTTQ